MSSRKSFTLIELLVVIAVISLITSFVLVTTRTSREKARIAKLLEFSQTIQNAIGAEAVGIWNFDEGSGTTANDSSGYRNNGTLYNFTSPYGYTEETPHKIAGVETGKYALSFDGVDDYVGGSSALPISSSYTVAAWFKRNGNPQGGGDNSYHTIIQNIAGYGAYPRLLISSSGSYILLQQADSAGTTVNLFVYNQPLGDNRFHYLAGTFDGSTMKLYVDGKFSGSNSCNGLKTGTTPYRIGAYSSVGTYQANGFIDEVRIYAQALTQAEIQKHYVEGLKKFQLVEK